VLNARLILIVLICASPAVVFFEGPIAHALVAGMVVVGMLTLLGTMRPGETTFFVSVARPFAFVVAVPAIWMLIQVLPLGVLSNPIWNSAETAVGHPIFGAISIDIGASVMALGQYLTLIGVVVLSGAVAVDRHRAEWILFSLMAATAVIALIAVINSRLSDLEPTSLIRMQSIDCAAMGVIIAGAAIIRTIERYETRHGNQDRSVPVLIGTLTTCVAALLICIIALVLGAKVNLLIATGYGIAGVAAVSFIRRLGFGPWGILAIVAPGVALAVFLAASNPKLGTNSLLLIFASQMPESLLGTAQRILTDTPLWGIGAGTFSMIAPIYSNMDEATSTVGPPTFAAAAAIELGRPLLWFILIATISAIVVLFRAALLRGRDSFYPAASASCLLTLLLLAFMNAGLSGMAEAIIAAVVFGLGLAQSKSRSVKR
jgi:hypothetical protein